MIPYNIMNVFSKRKNKNQTRRTAFQCSLLIIWLFSLFPSQFVHTSVFALSCYTQFLTCLSIFFFKSLIISLITTASTQWINSLPMTASHGAVLLKRRQLTFAKSANFPLPVCSGLFLHCSCVISIDTMGCLGNIIIQCYFM